MGTETKNSWPERHEALLGRARALKEKPLVIREEVLALRQEIRELERRIDRPLPPGVEPLRRPPSSFTERPGRLPPAEVAGPFRERRCPFGSCDGSGWHLRAEEDVADACRCRRLPADRSLRRQNAHVLRRHLALGLDSPPLSELERPLHEALGAYAGNLGAGVAAGEGLWLAGLGGRSEAPAAFLAGEALRHEIPVLLFPGEELIGRLRRLAAGGRVEGEIYGRLAEVELLIVDRIDAAAAPERYPQERVPRAGEDDAEEEDVGQDGPRPRAPYRPAMDSTDLGRLGELLEERWSAEKATILSTDVGPTLLEERLRAVPGEWPARSGRGQREGFEEITRRSQVTRRFLSRMRGLCGEPLRAAGTIG